MIETKSVLQTNDNKYFCIIYTLFYDMLFDVRKHPNYLYEQSKYEEYPRFNWASAYCFTGHVVGIFEFKGLVYIVGRVLYKTRQFEDQVYRIDWQLHPSLSLSLFVSLSLKSIK